MLMEVNGLKNCHVYFQSLPMNNAMVYNIDSLSPKARHFTNASSLRRVLSQFNSNSQNNEFKRTDILRKIQNIPQWIFWPRRASCPEYNKASSPSILCNISLFQDIKMFHIFGPSKCQPTPHYSSIHPCLKGCCPSPNPFNPCVPSFTAYQLS